MSQSRKKQAKEASKEPEVSSRRKAGDGLNRRTAFILAAVVVVLILAIVGIIGYPTYVAPFRRPIITVDNITIRMDYFLKRIKLTGSDPIGLLTELTNAQIIKLGAPQYGISVTPDDIDKTLRTIFQSQSGNVSESIDIAEADYKEWYRQLRNESALSDAEYRDIIAIEVFRSRLQEYLAARMPTVAEQVHLYGLYVATLSDAEAARARWAAGEKFGDLAKELSLDTATGQQSGELGWFAKGTTLPPLFEYEAFELSTGNVSQPLPELSDTQQPDGTSAPTVVGYHLIMVAEKAVRELDDNAQQTLRGKVVDNWLSTEREKYNVKWYGLSGNFDSETYAWIKYQMAKSNPTSTSSGAQ